MLACELPATTGVPLSRWSCAELAQELIIRGVVAFISAATVWRTLRSDAIRPWQYRSWIFPRAADFAAKAAVVLDLYSRIFEGKALTKREYVISSDEKTSIQARCRCHPSLPPGRARLMRVEHEYDRGGALAYLAAYDVHQARLFGRTAPSTGIEPFDRLVEDVMTVEPYASAKRVFWIVDNGSSHRGQASVDRLEGAWPNLRLIHLPIHASWLNQNRDRLFHHPAQSRHSQRLLRREPDRRPPGQLRGPLQPERPSFRLDLHPRRPQRVPRAHRRPRPGCPGAAGRRLSCYSRAIQAEGSPRYSPQAQSKASSGLPHHPGRQE